MTVGTAIKVDDAHQLSARPTIKALKAHDRAIVGVEGLRHPRSKDKMLITFAHDSIKLWRVTPSELIETQKISHWQCSIQCYDIRRLSSSSRRLITVVGVDSTLHQITIGLNGEEPIIHSHNRGLAEIWFNRISPTCDSLVSVAFSGTIQALSMTGELLRSAPFDKVKQVSALVHGTNYIAVGNTQGWISMISAQTLETLYSLEGHAMKIRCLAFTLEEGQLLSGSDDTTIKLYEVSTNSKGSLLRALCGHTAAVVALRVDRSCAVSERFASIGLDNRAIVWHLATGAKLHIIDYAMEGAIDTLRSVEFSLDGCQLICGTEKATITAHSIPPPDNPALGEESEVEEEEREEVIADEEMEEGTHSPLGEDGLDTNENGDQEEGTDHEEGAAANGHSAEAEEGEGEEAEVGDDQQEQQRELEMDLGID